ncbi:MAG TPA: protein kinase, partial [Trueperaceae bacterium]
MRENPGRRSTSRLWSDDKMNDKRVLHYQIFERLGIGGMGVVYRAVDSRLGRPVALKFLPESLQQDSEAAQRLIQEARAAAKLDHPNIGTVHAIETAPDGRVFMSLALYEGETLDARLERVGKLPFKEAVRIAMQVAQGLGHAHKAGVVHRDIKPGNIFLLSDGLVKILDFGIAKAAGMLDLTHTGALLGTNEYMSPQQVRGESVNQQADVWSLGVLLYKMIAGETPFFNEESPFAIIYAIATKTPDRLSVLDPALPAALDAVMDRALHKTLEGRYASTEEFHADLHALLSGGPVDPMTLTHYLETAAEAADPGGCPTNLPTRHRGIVGRAEELKLIDAYLADPDSRIVTLVGPGGMGKTSLSLAAAREQLEAGRFEHGIFFVALENTQMLDLVPEAIADAMGFSLQGPEPPERQVAARIGHKRILLVLDNFEHLVEGAGSLPELLADCPNLKVMVTSRVRLNLPEEWIIALQGLGVPPTGVGSSEDALAHGAVELFVRHARRVNPTFVLQSDNIEAVTEICRLVRGLPLGIELAAVWVRTLPAREIAREVQASYDFLASRSRGAG